VTAHEHNKDKSEVLSVGFSIILQFTQASAWVCFLLVITCIVVLHPWFALIGQISEIWSQIFWRQCLFCR